MIPVISTVAEFSDVENEKLNDVTWVALPVTRVPGRHATTSTGMKSLDIPMPVHFPGLSASGDFWKSIATRFFASAVPDWPNKLPRETFEGSRGTPGPTKEIDTFNCR